MNLHEILNRDTLNITKSRATRLTNAGVRSSNNYLQGLTEQKEQLEEQMEGLLDLSARVDINQGQKKLGGPEVSSAVLMYHTLREELWQLNRRIEVATAVNEELTTQTVVDDTPDPVL